MLSTATVSCDPSSEPSVDGSDEGSQHMVLIATVSCDPSSEPSQ